MSCNKNQVTTAHEIIFLGHGQHEIRDVPVFKLASVPAAYFFVAHMAVDADGSPHCYHPPIGGSQSAGDRMALDFLENSTSESRSFIQGQNGIGPANGFFVSATALQDGPPNDCSSFVDAETRPYIVLPGAFPGIQPRMQLGDCATVINLRSGATTHAIFADINPRVGEASVKTAMNLGLKNTSPKDGGDDADNYLYITFPGMQVKKPWNDADIKATADAAFAAWGGIAQAKACFSQIP
jgi:hypothetical protein